MFVTLVHVHVKPEFVDAFLDATRANHEGSVREPGNVRWDVLRLVEDPTRFVLYEWYADEDAARAHKDTAHYAAWRDAVTDWLVEPRVPVRYQGIFPEERGRPMTVPGPIPELRLGTTWALGRLPRITFGAGSMDAVPGIVAGHGRRVLLVTGQGSFAASGWLARLESGLADADVVLVGSVRVPSEPGPDTIDGAVRHWAPAGIQVVLGVGGGSALDAAKAIAALLRTGEPVRSHLEGFAGQQPYRGPAVPVVAVPTTAGTGSEATRNAVLSRRGADGFKRSFRDERLVPRDAVVDPELLSGLSPASIAFNGLDALTQLLESYVSDRAGPITDALALDGLTAIRDGLLAWHRDPAGGTAPAARARTAYGALLSGICLANAGLGAVHGLAAPLGALLPIPHGAACGAVLWQTTDVTIRALADRQPGSPALVRYAALGRLLARLPPGTSDEAARDALVGLLRDWVQALGVPGLASFGLDALALPAVVAGSRGSSMRTHPIALTDDDLDAILRASR